MKIARFFSALFASAGIVLMALTVGLCLFSLDAPVTVQEIPQEAVSCAQELADALNSGDLEQASQKLYGQPDLGVSAQPREELGALVWDAFLDSISLEFTGEFYADETGVCREAKITAMDIPAVTATWQGGVHTFLTADIQAAEDRGALMDIYDENYEFRADLVDKVLRETVEYSLREEAVFRSEPVTLRLIQRDGSWWVVPEDGLLRCLSGGLA